MIFKQITEVLDGRKTQTRRLWSGDGWATILSMITVGPSYKGQRILETLPNFAGALPINRETVRSVYAPSGALKWRIGNVYAVQPKRGAHGVGRIVIKTLSLERLHSTGSDDAIAEGLWEKQPGCWTTSIWEPSPNCFSNPIGAYARLWDSINTKKGTRWADNPLVWVISFSVIPNSKTLS